MYRGFKFDSFLYCIYCNLFNDEKFNLFYCSGIYIQFLRVIKFFYVFIMIFIFIVFLLYKYDIIIQFEV